MPHNIPELHLTFKPLRQPWLVFKPFALTSSGNTRFSAINDPEFEHCPSFLDGRKITDGVPVEASCIIPDNIVLQRIEFEAGRRSALDRSAMNPDFRMQ